MSSMISLVYFTDYFYYCEKNIAGKCMKVMFLVDIEKKKLMFSKVNRGIQFNLQDFGTILLQVPQNIGSDTVFMKNYEILEKYLTEIVLADEYEVTDFTYTKWYNYVIESFERLYSFTKSLTATLELDDTKKNALENIAFNAIQWYSKNCYKLQYKSVLQELCDTVPNKSVNMLHFIEPCATFRTQSRYDYFGVS